jgi:hypothetical protein
MARTTSRGQTSQGHRRGGNIERANGGIATATSYETSRATKQVQLTKGKCQRQRSKGKLANAPKI